MVFENMLRGLSGEPPAFRTFEIEDVNPVSGHTKRRKIAAPNEAMHLLHTRFASWIRTANRPLLRLLLRNATGSVPGGNPLKNVEPHRWHQYLYLIDIESAFPSVDGRRLANLIAAFYPWAFLGFEEEIYAFLKKYFLAPEGGIYVGGPASSDLFNLYAGALMDNPLRELCRERGITYTRYVDDLTFSVPDLSCFRLDSRIARRRIREIVWSAGFRISSKKAEFVDLVKGPAFVTGVGIRAHGELFLSRRYLRKIRGIMRRQETHGDVVPWSKLSSEDGVLYRPPVERKTGDRVVQSMMEVFFGITSERISARALDSVEEDLLRDWKRFQSSRRNGQS